MNIFNDPPSIPCVSCLRLSCERDVKIVAGVIVDNFDVDEEILDKKYTLWQKLMNFYADSDISSRSICKNCLLNFKIDKDYSLSILNDLCVPPFPPEIYYLNIYKKLLIQ